MLVFLLITKRYNMPIRILIPTDFSKNAFNAIEYAMALFQEKPCEFYFLHTYFLPGYARENFFSPKPSDADFEKRKERAEAGMKRFKTRMKAYEKNDSHTCHYLNEFGSFYDVMQQKAENNNIDLIIMGTKGQTDSKSVILGSNSVNVMEKIRICPTLAIPSDIKYIKPNEIVLPTSFRTDYDEKEINTLLTIADLTGAPIRVLHVQNRRVMVEARRKNKELLDNLLKDANYTHHTLYDIDLKTAVQAFVQSRESEMIAFVNKKHNFFGSIFSNPLVKELGMHTSIPLLAMHDKKD